MYPLVNVVSVGHVCFALFPKAYVLLLKGLRVARLSLCLFCLGLLYQLGNRGDKDCGKVMHVTRPDSVLRTSP